MPEENLTEEEQACLEEYNRIVEFARQVLSGIHPRVKISRETKHGTADPAKHPIQLKENSGQLLRPTMQALSTLPPPPPVPTKSESTSPITQESSTRTAPAHGSSKPVEPDEVSRDLEIDIDYKHDYYLDLGLKRSDNITPHSIVSAYRHKRSVWRPATLEGRERLGNTKPKPYRERLDRWDAIEKAYKILSNPKIRNLYNARYNGASNVKSTTPAKKSASHRVTKSSRRKKTSVQLEKVKTEGQTKQRRSDRPNMSGVPIAPRALLGQQGASFMQKKKKI